MDDTFTLLTKLFVDKMIKLDKLPYQVCGSVIKNCKIERTKSTDGKMYTSREKGKIF